jgi:hypothetical protein
MYSTTSVHPKYGSSSTKPYVINGAGSFDWGVRTALPEGFYMLRNRAVSTALQGFLDYSDTSFSMVKSFALTFPNGGEQIE